MEQPKLLLDLNKLCNLYQEETCECYQIITASLNTSLFTGETDIVCVIGMVKVQIVGSVRTGERIYASTDNPGTGIAESHLPLGAFIFRDHTLLGMAMEPCQPCYHDEMNLVKCFVCIVLGINSHQLSSEVENIMENVDMDIKVAIGKSNKRNCRREYCLFCMLFILRRG